MLQLLLKALVVKNYDYYNKKIHKTQWHFSVKINNPHFHRGF